MGPDLTISIISADNLELLLPCLDSLLGNTQSIEVEIFVIDNASNDASAKIVREKYPHVTVIQNASRLGFSTNNNLVLDRGRGRYLMLLNDDTLILEGALDQLVAFMDTHPDVGVVGAALLNPDGSSQPSCSRFPNPLTEAVYPATNWSYRLGRSGKPREVDSVCGAALLVRREVYESVGGLDTAFDPIYSEEVDWCYRIRKAGWKIYALPLAQIVHYGSYTMNRVVKRKYELLLSHKALFFRKNYGPVTANVYKTVLRVSTLLKVLWWSLAAYVLRDHETCRERRDLHKYILRTLPSF